MFARVNWRHFDWVLLFVVLVLCGFSVAMIYSATHNSPDLADYWQRQVNFVGIGLVALFLVALLDYRQLSLLAVPSFIVFILLLVAVYFFGDTQGSAPGQFYAPHGIAINSRGEIFVVDSYNHRVQKFIPKTN